MIRFSDPPWEWEKPLKTPLKTHFSIIPDSINSLLMTYLFIKDMNLAFLITFSQISNPPIKDIFTKKTQLLKKRWPRNNRKNMIKVKKSIKNNLINTTQPEKPMNKNTKNCRKNMLPKMRLTPILNNTIMILSGDGSRLIMRVMLKLPKKQPKKWLSLLKMENNKQNKKLGKLVIITQNHQIRTLTLMKKDKELLWITLLKIIMAKKFITWLNRLLIKMANC